MKSTSAAALMLGMWVFSGCGWGITQAAEPSLGSSFEEWCKQKASLSAEARRTVELLLEQAGTSDCEVAANNLSSRTELTIYGLRPIIDLAPLAGLTNLKNLHLSGKITNLTPLANLTNLEELYLETTSTKDITPLAGLTNLKTLRLYNNAITNVTPLARLTNLKELDLTFNQITNVSPLSSLTNLTKLDLSGNQITDFSSLSRLTHLTELSLTIKFNL
jgi:internalin A